MQATLQNRINSYALAATCFLFANNDVLAQVVYTDIDPDIVLNDGGEVAEIDMNNDGVSDFFFHNNSFQYYNSSWLSFRTMKNILAGPDEVGNAFAGVSNYFNTGYNAFTWYYPFALDNGILINNELTWQNNETQIMALRIFSEDGDLVGLGFYCYWSETETIDKYLGVQFKDLDDQSHYGWIRCDVLDEGRTLIIKDYAYDQQPNYPIEAGDTIEYVGIISEENTLSQNTYSFGDVLYINFSIEFNGLLSVCTIDGKEIFKDEINGTNYSKALTLADGIYLVNLKTEKSSCSKKIFIR